MRVGHKGIFSPVFPPATENRRQASLSETRTVSKGHGRIVQRHLQISARLAGHLDWPGLAQVCRLERTTRCKDRTTVEIQYAITTVRS